MVLRSMIERIFLEGNEVMDYKRRAWCEAVSRGVGR